MPRFPLVGRLAASDPELLMSNSPAVSGAVIAAGKGGQGRQVALLLLEQIGGLGWVGSRRPRDRSKMARQARSSGRTVPSLGPSPLGLGQSTDQDECAQPASQTLTPVAVFALENLQHHRC